MAFHEKIFETLYLTNIVSTCEQGNVKPFTPSHIPAIRIGLLNITVVLDKLATRRFDGDI